MKLFNLHNRLLLCIFIVLHLKDFAVKTANVILLVVKICMYFGLRNFEKGPPKVILRQISKKDIKEQKKKIEILNLLKRIILMLFGALVKLVKMQGPD